jgi:hypothetical protein
MIWQTITIVVIMLGLALKEEILPMFLGAGDHARLIAEYNIYFTNTAMFLSHAVAALTAVSGGIYLWDGRDLYMEHT